METNTVVAVSGSASANHKRTYTEIEVRRRIRAATDKNIANAMEIVAAVLKSCSWMSDCVRSPESGLTDDDRAARLEQIQAIQSDPAEFWKQTLAERAISAGPARVKKSSDPTVATAPTTPKRYAPQSIATTADIADGLKGHINPLHCAEQIFTLIAESSPGDKEKSDLLGFLEARVAEIIYTKMPPEGLEEDRLRTAADRADAWMIRHWEGLKGVRAKQSWSYKLGDRMRTATPPPPPARAIKPRQTPKADPPAPPVTVQTEAAADTVQLKTHQPRRHAKNALRNKKAAKQPHA
jgi:hypothetical protein